MPNEKKEQNVTMNCRYIDLKRRTVIPAPVIEQAGIPLCSVLDWQCVNGCLVGSPVVGIAVVSHVAAGKLVKKGRI